jgi:YHS domain-containing protein
MFAILLRFLLLFVIVSLVRSVVNSVVRALRGQGGQPGAQSPRPSSAPPGDASPPEATASTLLHQDPVCGTYVAGASSLRKICRGKVYHFCSEQCRDRYNG